MDRPLRQHILELEKRVEQLSQDIMQNRKTGNSWLCKLSNSHDLLRFLVTRH